jgi:membrane-bound lytic murein transglycosylase D
MKTTQYQKGQSPFIPTILFWSFVLLILPSFTAMAQAQSKKMAVSSTLIPVSYPEILKGNEASSLQYIEQFGKSRRNYIISMYKGGKKMLPQAAAILKKYRIPQEFKVLLILESAYNANAVSNAGAVGYWQIMDEVAKEYGMKYCDQITPIEKRKLEKINKVKADSLLVQTKQTPDDRKNFVKATQVAARYLADRKRNLNGNWLLMVASYNCGIGNVWEAMKKSGKKNPSFWDIKALLPAETQAYVLNFIALNVIFHQYDQFLKNQLAYTLPDTEPQQDMAINNDCPAATAQSTPSVAKN